MPSNLDTIIRTSAVSDNVLQIRIPLEAGSASRFLNELTRIVPGSHDALATERVLIG